MTQKYIIQNDGEQNSIQCLVCNRISHNPNDIEHKYCGWCNKYLDGQDKPQPTMPTNQVAQQQTDPDRQKKIIVALFLILGKALNKLPHDKRHITVTETEIRDAWLQQRSPVRIVSRVEETFFSAGLTRIFETVLQELDLQKTGMFSPGEKYPEFKEPHPKENHELSRKRCFDLE